MFEYFYRRRQRSNSNNNHSGGFLFVDENCSIFVRRSILDDPSMTLPFGDRRVYFPLCGFPSTNRLFRDQRNVWTYRWKSCCVSCVLPRFWGDTKQTATPAPLYLLITRRWTSVTDVTWCMERDYLVILASSLKESMKMENDGTLLKSQVSDYFLANDMHSILGNFSNKK